MINLGRLFGKRKITLPVYQQQLRGEGYEQSNLTPVNESIIDILTSDEMGLIGQMRPDHLQRSRPVPVGINYGEHYSIRPKSIVFEGVRYDIDVANKVIALSQRNPQPAFWDADKVPCDRHYIIEASLDEVLQEFSTNGFRVAR